MTAVALQLLRKAVPADPWDNPTVWPEWRQLLERAFTLDKRLQGEDHPDTLSSANNLASNLYALGQYKQARQLHEDTLTRDRRILGEDHPHALSSANNLAIDLDALGEHQQARQLHEDTLTRRRRILGEDHPHTLSSALGQQPRHVLRALGDDEQARQPEEYVRAHRKG
ncbi:MAG: tetratricopeptide repeat protein [Pseudonocardiaceae bacterium]